MGCERLQNATEGFEDDLNGKTVDKAIWSLTSAHIIFNASRSRRCRRLSYTGIAAEVARRARADRRTDCV